MAFFLLPSTDYFLTQITPKNSAALRENKKPKITPSTQIKPLLLWVLCVNELIMYVFRNYLLNDGNCKFFRTLSKENDKNVWKKKEKYVPLPQIWITMPSLYPYKTD